MVRMRLIYIAYSVLVGCAVETTEDVEQDVTPGVPDGRSRAS